MRIYLGKNISISLGKKRSQKGRGHAQHLQLICVICLVYPYLLMKRIHEQKQLLLDCQHQCQFVGSDFSKISLWRCCK